MTEFDYKDYLQSHLVDADGYQELSYPKDLTDFIKLDGNENPYGPSDNVIKALSQVNDLQLYPNSTDHLKEKIAQSLDVLTDNIVCGAGADAVINLIFSSLKKEQFETGFVLFSKHRNCSCPNPNVWFPHSSRILVQRT